MDNKSLSIYECDEIAREFMEWVSDQIEEQDGLRAEDQEPSEGELSDSRKTA